MSSRGAAAVVAGLLIIVGLVIGFIPHSVNDSVIGTVHCGAPFVPKSSDADAADLGSAMAGVSTSFTKHCGDKLGAPRAIALTASGIGALALLFCGLTATRKPTVEPKPTVAEIDPQSL